MLGRLPFFDQALFISVNRFVEGIVAQEEELTKALEDYSTKTLPSYAMLGFLGKYPPQASLAPGQTLK